MRDQFELGTTVPHSENCAQMGDPNFSTFSRMEANALKRQIVREIGEGPVSFKLIACPHDFGTYYDLAVIYDDENEKSTEWMLKIESSIPDQWDEESKRELREAGYTLPFVGE